MGFASRLDGYNIEHWLWNPVNRVNKITSEGNAEMWDD